MSEVRLKRSDILEQMRTAEDVLDRIVVSAPASGTVMNLHKYNSGAVVTPGQEILEIVPDGTGLIVEAHVQPQDIDEVRIGQAARLTFSALDAREMPQVPGEVVHVSADRLEDERTGEVYYLARLQISSEPLAGFDPSRGRSGSAGGGLHHHGRAHVCGLPCRADHQDTAQSTERELSSKHSVRVAGERC